MKAGTVKDARTGQVGRPTGGSRRCTLEGCTGLRIGVRWPDGRLTWPCTKGMFEHDGQLVIGRDRVAME